MTISGPKGAKMSPKIIFRIFNFLFPWLNHNCSKKQNMAMKHPNIAKNSQKHYFVTTNDVFLTKNWPKKPKKNFARYNTVFKWWKATVPSFWQSFRLIWCAVSKKMPKNLDFWAKMAIFRPKTGKKILQHNWNVHWTFF